jgi:hypothetical protein
MTKGIVEELRGLLAKSLMTVRVENPNLVSY